MKITVLLENTSTQSNLTAEHGLSLLIETKPHIILFDMGQSDAFAKNAEQLGTDLALVDTAILSHGHYDHGGGLEAFLTRNHTAPVWVSRYAFEPHFHGPERYIGLDVSLQGHPRLRLAGENPVWGEGLTLYTCSQMERQHPIDNSGLQVKENGVLVPEDFRHEQYLLAESQGRRILFSGCSHRGILDIVQWFRPDVLIGGFHFSGLPLDETLAGYARTLNSFQTEYYTCHCTGVSLFEFMKQYMPRLHYLSCGQTLWL